MERKFLSFSVAVRTVVSAVAVFAAILAVGLWFDRRSHESRPPIIHTVKPGSWADVANGGLVADCATLDFGQQPRGEPFEFRISLYNPTDRSVTIEKFQQSCGIAVWNGPLEIPSGESRAIRVRHLNHHPDIPDPRPEIRDWRMIVPVIPAHRGRHPGWEIVGTFVNE